MRTKLTAPFRSVLARESHRAADVHFHVDGAGRPFVCDHARCESARLTDAELHVGR